MDLVTYMVPNMIPDTVPNRVPYINSIISEASMPTHWEGVPGEKVHTLFLGCPTEAEVKLVLAATTAEYRNRWLSFLRGLKSLRASCTS